MGIEALTHREDGIQVAVPASREDWQQWVSAGRTRNWMLQDPLVDWLQLYYKDRDYIPRSALEGYDRNLDFVQFIFERAQAFESGILRLLQQRYEVVTVAHGPSDIRELRKAEETFSHMQAGVPIIYQGVLWDAHHMTYGSPDFLIRSDVLNQLFPASFPESMAAAPASDLGDVNWHYCVVDTKFTTLHLNASETELLNGGSAKAYKAQLFIYNRMLGLLQGYGPPQSFLLGRGWEFESKGVKYRGSNAFDRLGPVKQQGTITGGVPLAVEVDHALGWVRRVRTVGGDWDLLPQPSVPELYPNMTSNEDDMMVDIAIAEIDDAPVEEQQHQWVSVKEWLAGELKELTQLWQVGVGKRDQAHASGLYRWDDPDLTPASVGIAGGKQGPTLQQILDVNREGSPPVQPQRIAKTRPHWHTPASLEFYVDFEFCTDLADDFSLLPEKGGQPLIFMIGCGHVEENAWQFRSFVVRGLNEPEELRIILEWSTYMAKVQDRFGTVLEAPRVFHWSHAEVTALDSAYNSARARHHEPSTWPKVDWYDFLSNVMREEPVVVRGALGFGLKAIANAMNKLGLIDTNWSDSPVDGLGAMVGAWRCDEERQATSLPLDEMPLMKEIAGYNEVDCKVMMEIISYLRTNH